MTRNMTCADSCSREQGVRGRDPREEDWKEQTTEGERKGTKVGSILAREPWVTGLKLTMAQLIRVIRSKLKDGDSKLSKGEVPAMTVEGIGYLEGWWL